MKCNNCGAEIGLLDEKCPYCGAVNMQSTAHLKEMEQYQDRSKKTKGKVKESIAANIPILVGAVIMVLLVIGIGVSSYVAENASLFRHRASRSEAVKKHEEYSQILRQYLKDGDYAAFSAFKGYHVVPEYEEEYKEFEKVCDMIGAYCRAMNGIEECVLYGADSPRYGLDSDISSCQMGIENFYYEYERKLPDMEGDPYMDNVIDMKKKMDAAMKIYLGLDGGELEEYLASSSNKQEAYLEEVLGNE